MENNEKIQAIREILKGNDPYDSIIRDIKRIILGYRKPLEIASKYSLEDIERQIVEHSGLPIKAINKKTRKKEILLVRQMAHYKSEKFTNNFLSEIGDYFGSKDHSTVLNSVKTINNLLDTDRKFREQHETFLTT